MTTHTQGFVLFLVALLLTAVPALATDDIAKGMALADKNCGICHALGPSRQSPHVQAPPFRDIAQNYDDGELEDAFADGVATEHPDMPDWTMTDVQARELAAYIMSLAKLP